jgi:zinc protease
MMFFLAMSLPAMAQGIDRSKPPDTPPLAPYKLPAVFETKLSNGLQVMLAGDRRFPLVTLRIGFRAGSRFDPSGQAGLSEMAASLLKSGTPTRSARQIAEELAAIGGTLDASNSLDSLTVSGSALAEHASKLLDVAADVIRNASFPQEEIDLRKQNRLQELEHQLSQSDVLASRKLNAMVFGEHPYARTMPTRQSIQSIRREDLAGFRARLLVPSNAALILIGAIPPQQRALAMIGERLESWTGKPPDSGKTPAIPDPARSITLIDRPGSAQVDIRIGHVSVNRNHPDHFPLLVGNTILGGGASSRMFVNIREKQGFAYQVGSHHGPLKDAGLLTVVTQVREEVLEQALTAVLAEMDRMVKQPVEKEELSGAKNLLNGMFVMLMANQDGLAAQLATLKLNGVQNDYLEKYVTRVRSVEPELIQKAASKYINTAEASIVVVGDASKIAGAVEKFGKVVVEKVQ